MQGIAFKATGADTDGAYALCEFEAYDVPAHIHLREDESLYVLTGEADVTVGDTTTRVATGDFIFMPKGIPHSIAPVPGVATRMLAISTPPGFEHFMEDLTEALAAGHDRGSPEVAAIRERYGWVPVVH